jgi:CRISPR/Cas system-associated protein endoribonuclease Cas2
VTDVSQIANVIYIEPREETKGTEVTVPILMKNTAQIRGFQFDLYLPEGVTVAKMANNRFMASLSNGRKPEGSVHTLTVSEQQDGAIRFLCGSQYDETFTGTEGEIATIKLVLADDMAEGSYPIVLKNVKLTETNISNYYLTETVQTALNVVSYTPGDISGDGIIDVSDYIGVANYILGEEQVGIVAAAADVNKDQVVDVSDYIGVANLILYNNIFGQTASAARGLRKANTDISGNDNVIYIEPLQTPSNTQLQLSLKMKNTAAIRGFQTDVYLPEGVTAVKNSNGRYLASLTASRLPEGSAHTLTVSEQPDGAIRLLCGSQYDETFTGSDGEIATLTISVSGDMNPGDYPIVLRYVKLTETNISNYYLTDEVETTMNVTGPSDGRVTFDENATALPDYTAGETANVRVRRTIKANEWSTICLPFAMTANQCKTAFGNDVQLADFKDYDTTEDEGENIVGITVNFETVTAIEANHPYIIKVSEAVTEFTVDGVDIDPEDDPCVEYDNGLTGKKRKVLGRFAGTYTADFDFYNEAENYPLFLSGNQFYYATETTKHMKAFRAYFDFVDNLPEAEGENSRIALAFIDDATGISEIENRKSTNGKYFDLQGRSVIKPGKGLYVKDGRKVMIK